MAATRPNRNALASADHRSAGCTSTVKPEKYAPAVAFCTSTLNTKPPARPARLTSGTSSTEIVAAAHMRGVTSRWIGLTAITSIAAISSRILREPRSAVMAEPPAPAISSAVATGAASRTIASTMAAPVFDSAPS